MISVSGKSSSEVFIEWDQIYVLTCTNCEANICTLCAIENLIRRCVNLFLGSEFTHLLIPYHLSADVSEAWISPNRWMPFQNLTPQHRITYGTERSLNFHIIRTIVNRLDCVSTLLMKDSAVTISGSIHVLHVLKRVSDFHSLSLDIFRRSLSSTAASR